MASNLSALVCKVEPLYKEFDLDAIKVMFTSPDPDCRVGSLVPDSSTPKAPIPVGFECPPAVHAAMPVMSGLDDCNQS